MRRVAEKIRRRSAAELLAEKLAILEALRKGEADALVVQKGGVERIYTLAGAESAYRQFVESMNEGAATVQRDGTILYCNPQFAALLETSTEHVIGTDLARWVKPASRSSLGPLLSARTIATDEMIVLTSSGSEIPVLLSGRELDLNGIEAMGLLFWDQRDRLHAEAALVRHASELERLNRELAEASRYKDEFLSVISHELRTPLNFITGFASILEDEIDGALNDRQRQHLRKIEEWADRMLRLVEDLLDLARLQVGRLDLSRTDVAYEELVKKVVEPFVFEANRKDIQLSVAPAADPVSVFIDEARIGQVLTNLLSNAIKFTPSGGEVRVQVSTDGEKLMTEVVDTGIGIGAEALPKLFGKFYQVNMSSNRQSGGTGLGLAISKGLVEEHGGEIGVRSEPGSGSTFWFALPLRR